MAKSDKMKRIGSALNKNFNDLIKELYIEKELSSAEIANFLFQKTGVKITPRSIQRQLRTLNCIRSFSEAFNLAIRKGRKSYDKLRRPIKSKDLRKGVDLKTRYRVLIRDNSRCVLCGKTAQNDLLVIDHIIPVTKGGTNDLCNLRILCRECNHGKMLLHEHI